MHDRHGELLPNGFHVGDLITYQSSGERRYGVVIPVPTRWRNETPETGTSRAMNGPDAKWCMWQNTEAAALSAYAGYNPEDRGESYFSRHATLIRRYDEQERSNTMSIQFNGETIDTDQAVAEVVEGQEYRLVYPRDYHDFEFIGKALDSGSTGNTRRFEIVRWVRENNDWGPRVYNVGHAWSAASEHRHGNPTCLILPAVAPAPAATDTAYNGTPGTFEPHNGNAPESGTIVRAFAAGNSTRQVEGLFLRIEGSEATVERKRKRTKRLDGTFTAWENYTTAGRTTVLIEGAEVFKPGASATPTLHRTTAITSSREGERAEIGDVISAPTEYRADTIYRGKVTDTHRYAGEYTITATEKAELTERQQRATDGAYVWETIPEQEITVYAYFMGGQDKRNSAGWKWDLVGPGVQRVDPAYDPKRKTTHTGMKIGDLVVGLNRDSRHGRDTVSSWVKGEIFKWDTRYNRPYVKVTEPMESDKKVGDEVMLEADDVYPALADPKNSDPEEFKKILRQYLIGRHKRGDFCRGGLNTMLAAFGVPLYETRRRAQMVIAVDYDPNETDLYQVQNNLRRNLPGVSGLGFSERSGEDIELNVESDVTAG